MSHSRLWSGALLAVTLTVVLAACGGTAPTPASQPTAAPTAAQAEQPTAAQAEQPTAAQAEQPTAAQAEQPTAAQAEQPAAGGTLNGVTLPPDAAPPEQQVLIQHYDNTANATTLDFWESVYKRGGAADLFTEPLVRINKDFEIVPPA